jgi:zinc transporter ZupT
MIEAWLGAICLALIHLFASKLRFLDVIPRSRWLSIAGGVAVGYALVHLLPELQKYHEVLRDSASKSRFEFIAEHLVWVLVLLGLVVFYGLEKVAARAKTDKGETSSSVFWLHITSFGVYNALLGYLLVREDRGLRSLVLFLIGIGLHFLVNDHGLRQHHKERYRRKGRWVLSGTILAGCLVGVLTEVHEAVMASVVAFLAGGILLNTFKEELPEERESRFWAFAMGAFGYAAILLAI